MDGRARASDDEEECALYTYRSNPCVHDYLGIHSLLRASLLHRCLLPDDRRCQNSHRHAIVISIDTLHRMIPESLGDMWFIGGKAKICRSCSPSLDLPFPTSPEFQIQSETKPSLSRSIGGVTKSSGISWSRSWFDGARRWVFWLGDID